MVSIRRRWQVWRHRTAAAAVSHGGDGVHVKSGKAGRLSDCYGGGGVRLVNWSAGADGGEGSW